ncbi:MAG: zinc-dependent alcohol dehydrogenase family protein [Pseudomonadota bacterium]|jgi:NADPH:quinone reductase-like Zn-dependent oxidoreductase
MARVVRFHQTGGPEVLQLEDEPQQKPGIGEARIRIQSIGLNRAEASFRSGTYLEKPVLPSRIGYEAAGVIDELGEPSSEFKVGDAVSILPTFSMTRYGVAAEEAIVPIDSLILRPAELDTLTASAVWMPYLTAWGGLHEIHSLTTGGAALITAASSSVGLAAIQVVNRIGGVSIAITRTNEKRDALLAAGAQHVIVTSENDLAERVAAITRGQGARVVFDPVAGPGVVPLADTLGYGGEVIVYGNLSGRAHETPFPYRAAMKNGVRMRGYFVIQDLADKTNRRRAAEFVLSGLKDHSLKPTIAKTFPLDQIVDAHRYLESNQQIGKVVVTVP